MADEISSVIKMEMDGVTMVVKASVKAAAFVVQLLKALAKHMTDARINRPGESRFADISKISEGEPVVVNVPQESLKDFKLLAMKHKLHFHLLPDLNSSDRMTPVYIPRQELGIVNSFIKESLENRKSESEKTMVELDSKINERKEQLINSSPQGRRKLNVEIDHLQQAKEEIKKIIDQDKTELGKDDHSMSFTDYLATGKGTTVEKDPDGVVESMAEGGKSVQIFKAKELFEPIRSEQMVPDGGKVSFIVPETGAMVTRSFYKDEDTGTWYSRFIFKDKDGNVNVFSDKDVTKDDWFNGRLKNANISDLFTKTGILEGTMCEYYDTEDSLKAALNRYQAYAEKFSKMHKDKEGAEEEGQNSENQKDEKKEEDVSFSSADAEEEIKKAASQKKKGDASADSAADKVIFEVPSDRIYIKDGYVNLIVDDNQTIQVKNIDLVSKDDVKTVFSVKSKDKLRLANNLDNSFKYMSPKDGLDLFNNVGSGDVKPDMSDAAAFTSSAGKNR